LIGKLPSTLDDRSIPIELQRLKRTERIERFRIGKGPAADLARMSARWAADNWRPLLAIADRVGDHWPELAREAALTLNSVDSGEDVKTLLLGDIRNVLGERPSIPSKELADALGAMEGRPWPEFGRSRKAITTHTLARLLKPLMIFPGDVRDGPDNFKGYKAADFAEAFERYLGAPEPTEPVTQRRTDPRPPPATLDAFLASFDTAMHRHGIEVRPSDNGAKVKAVRLGLVQTVYERAVAEDQLAAFDHLLDEAIERGELVSGQIGDVSMLWRPTKRGSAE
jgi:uncharacterized protein DUF3631